MSTLHPAASGVPPDSMPANSVPRSLASRSITFVPQPTCWRSRMSAQSTNTTGKPPVNGKRGAHLGGADALLNFFEEGGVARDWSALVIVLFRV